jgi:hypothetical protein
MIVGKILRRSAMGSMAGEDLDEVLAGGEVLLGGRGAARTEKLLGEKELLAAEVLLGAEELLAAEVLLGGVTPCQPKTELEAT